MNLLITYYLFLVAGAVLMMVLRESPLVLRRRSQYLSYLSLPPLLLIAQAANLGVILTALLVLALLIPIDRLARRVERPVTQSTSRLFLIIWLVEAVLPVSLHFAVKGRNELERVSLLIAGVVLLASTLLTFFVFASDLRERA